MSKIKHKDTREFTIKRAAWMRNTKDYTFADSYLLDQASGKMCCLGFYAKACKFASQSILGVQRPDELCQNKGMYWKSFLIDSVTYSDEPHFEASDDAERLMEINDDSSTTDAYKEKRIKHIFAKHKIKVTFVD